MSDIASGVQCKSCAAGKVEKKFIWLQASLQDLAVGIIGLQHSNVLKAPCNIPKDSIPNPETIFCILSEQKSEKTTHKRVKTCLNIIFLGIVNEEVKVFNRKYSLKIK